VYPVGGEVFSVGSVVPIQWVATDNVVGVVILVSPDNGENWYVVTDPAVTRLDPVWGNYPWVVPATVEPGIPLNTSTCKLRLYNYMDPSMLDQTVTSFTVPVIDRPTVETEPRAIYLRHAAGRLTVAVPWKGAYVLEVSDLLGRRMLTGTYRGPGEHILPCDGLDGTYVLKVSSPHGQEHAERFVVRR
jgi:hypothetical protein